MSKKSNNPPYHYKENSFFKYVQEKMDQLKMDDQTFLRLMGYDKESMSKEFVGGFVRRGNTQPVFKRQVIRKLYQVCHINPEDFLLDEEIEKEWLSKNAKTERSQKSYFTHDYWNLLKAFIPSKNPLLDLIPISPINPEVKATNDELTNLYQKLADERFRTAENKIIVHELLFKGNNNNPGSNSTYREAQALIFSAIDEVLAKHKREKTTFTYIRVLYLSPSESIHLKTEKKDNIVKNMLIEAGIETLKHINDCYEHYPKFSSFYVAPCSQFRSHCLIDDKIFLSEDYLKQHNYILPYLLYIDDIKVESELKKLKKHFDLELTEKKESTHPLNKGDIPFYLNQAVLYLDKEVKYRESVLDIAESILEKNATNEIAAQLKVKEDAILEILKKQRENLTAKKVVLT